MLDEAKAMIRVSRHDHIVNFQGICVANDSVYLLLEYCTLGKVIYPKSSKHWLSTLPHTIDCVCSKILNRGLNHKLSFWLEKTF